MSKQSMAALAYGNEVRLKRSAYRRQLMKGDADPTDMVADPESWAETWRVEPFLRAIPGVGFTTAQKLLLSDPQRRILPKATLGSLQVRQRHALIQALRKHESKR